VTAKSPAEKRDFLLISLLSSPCSLVQGISAGLKLAKKGETAEKELCLQLLAARQMLYD